MKILKFQTYNHGFWFRIFGAGLSIEIAKYHQMMFSERNGITKPLYVFGLRIKYLKKDL
jgi:hypothetical protein